MGAELHQAIESIRNIALTAMIEGDADARYRACAEILELATAAAEKEQRKDGK